MICPSMTSDVLATELSRETASEALKHTVFGGCLSIVHSLASSYSKGGGNMV